MELPKRLSELELAVAFNACKDAGALNAAVALSGHITWMQIDADLQTLIPPAVREAAVRLIEWYNWQEREYFANADDILTVCNHILGKEAT